MRIPFTPSALNLAATARSRSGSSSTLPTSQLYVLGATWLRPALALSSGGWPFLSSALARFGRPRPQARPPGRYGAPVRGVLVAVARAQRRLFVAPHEHGDDEPERGRVREQERASENERLAHDCCADGEVHRIAHMAIQPADDEPLRRRHRCRRPMPLEDEAGERM